MAGYQVEVAVVVGVGADEQGLDDAVGADAAHELGVEDDLAVAGVGDDGLERQVLDGLGGGRCHGVVLLSWLVVVLLSSAMRAESRSAQGGTSVVVSGPEW